MAPSVRARPVAVVVLSLSLWSIGCGDDPADVAGTYTIALTNRENGCNLGNWTVDATTNGVVVAISQTDAAVSAEVMGLAASALDFLLGAHVYTGSVDGEQVSLSITGTRGTTQGACAYTLDSVLGAGLTGDALNGTVVYRAKTNGATDCGSLTGCTSRQDFAGARPPQ